MMSKYCLIVFCFCVFSFACQKKHVNPYDEQELPINGNDSTIIELPASSFNAIHANILHPTCARSGCHDGHFEPDFRTQESSYNTLVNHPIIKNDPQGTYQVRVQPGSPNQSLLLARLTVDIDGNSGIMPLSVDSDSDWETNKADYIKNITDWIQNGAKR